MSKSSRSYAVGTLGNLEAVPGRVRETHHLRLRPRPGAFHAPYSPGSEACPEYQLRNSYHHQPSVIFPDLPQYPVEGITLPSEGIMLGKRAVSSELNPGPIWRRALRYMSSSTGLSRRVLCQPT